MVGGGMVIRSRPRYALVACDCYTAETLALISSLSCNEIDHCLFRGHSATKIASFQTGLVKCGRLIGGMSLGKLTHWCPLWWFFIVIIFQIEMHGAERTPEQLLGRPRMILHGT